ncbi:MAG: DUF445 domain-containing protein [Desulfitobacteriaceae bacterium]
MNYQRKANLTLAGVFLLFTFSTLLRHLYPSLSFFKLINFVLEAALVGGIADWFAVTALFRRPLGWPFHTALIPRNREKVIESIGNMVQHDLLNLELIKQKIAALSVAQSLINHAERNNGLQDITALLWRYTLEKLEAMDPQTVGYTIGEKVIAKLNEYPIAPEISKLLRGWQKNQIQWFGYLVNKLIELASQPQTKESLTRFLEEQKEAKLGDSPLSKYLFSFMEKIDGVNMDEAATSLQSQLCVSLEELKNPEHPLHQRVKVFLENTISALEIDASSQKAMENWKEEILEVLPWGATLTNLISKILPLVVYPNQATPGAEPLLSQWLTNQIETAWLHFKENRTLQNKVDQYTRTALIRLSAVEHDLVGKIAKDTLRSLNDADLNKFVEDKAGNDLQWIRINGSLVGGFMGLALSLFLSFIYDPLVVPFIHNLLK